MFVMEQTSKAVNCASTLKNVDSCINNLKKFKRSIIHKKKLYFSTIVTACILITLYSIVNVKYSQILMIVLLGAVSAYILAFSCTLSHYSHIYECECHESGVEYSKKFNMDYLILKLEQSKKEPEVFCIYKNTYLLCMAYKSTCAIAASVVVSINAIVVSFI